MQHIFFQNFGPGQQQVQNNINMTEPLQHNLLILEMANNFGFVRWLMYRIKENRLGNVDPLEQEWLNFINKNNIDIESYKNDEDFIEKHFKSLI